MYPIEKGIPMPESRGKKYPFAKLEVGESFSVSYRTGKDELSGQRLVATVCNATSKASKELAPKRFRSLKMVEEGVIRVWRKE